MRNYKGKSRKLNRSFIPSPIYPSSPDHLKLIISGNSPGKEQANINTNKSQHKNELKTKPILKKKNKKTAATTNIKIPNSSK